MLSRVADALFWMSRYMERAENHARIISVHMESRLEHLGTMEEDLPLEYLIGINTDPDLFRSHHPQADAHSAVDFICFSRENPSALLRSIEAARDNARNIRDMIPAELWEVINGFYWEARAVPETPWKVETLGPFLTFVKERTLHFQGVVDAVMSRGEPFLFITLGKFLERAAITTRALDMSYHRQPTRHVNQEIVSHHHWISLLESMSGYEAYARRYRSFVEPGKVAEFLIFDPEFPRSVRFCASGLMNAFNELEQGKVNRYTRDLYVSLGNLYASLNFSTAPEMLEDGAFQPFLRELYGQYLDIGQHIGRTFYLGEIRT